MPRAPLNVLVLPFRRTGLGRWEYAIFRRADGDGHCWQGVAGGVEDNEIPLAAAQRELQEETGCIGARKRIELDARASIPAGSFSERGRWGKHVYVVPEIPFGVELFASDQIVIGLEHSETRWCSFEEAQGLLRW